MKKFLNALKKAFDKAFSFGSIVGFLFWVSTTLNLYNSGKEIGIYGAIILNVIMIAVICNFTVFYYNDD